MQIIIIIVTLLLNAIWLWHRRQSARESCLQLSKISRGEKKVHDLPPHWSQVKKNEDVEHWIEAVPGVKWLGNRWHIVVFNTRHSNIPSGAWMQHVTEH